MAFLTQRFLQSATMSPRSLARTQLWDAPDKVVLPVADGVTPVDKPPVRIYLGTEPAQYKAERIFIWSIEQVRDPARVYEIYLMKNLREFHSRFWLTGFTNYRFAIPHFAGGEGRAIYNDVDQIYLRDPALLFDLPMQDHGYLAIDPGDISVALFDCRKMKEIWSLDDAKTVNKNKLLARASNTPGLWGALAGGWNARDLEYVPGETGVLHYTILHRQPWHPFPGKFVYQKNSLSGLWFDLEKSADEAAYRVFQASSPSQGFTGLKKRAGKVLASKGNEEGKDRFAGESGDESELAAILKDCETRSLAHYRIEAFSRGMTVPLAESLESIDHIDPLMSFPEDDEAPVDGVICSDTLEYVPDDDVPWLLEALFSRASGFVYCLVRMPGSSLAPPLPWDRSVEWWHYQFRLAARHHPDVRWRLVVQRTGSGGRQGVILLEGNESVRREARVWTIIDDKPGHNSQSRALAEMLGWSTEEKVVRQTPANLLRVFAGRMPGGNADTAWPDVVIACGWWPCHVARRIRRRSGGKTRLLLAGRKSGGVRSVTDIVVNCAHFHLPTHHRRLETLLPVHPITESKLNEVRPQGEALFAGAQGPRVVLLAGGGSRQFSLSGRDAAEMGRQIMDSVRKAGGTLYCVTSRRTGSEAAHALREALGDEAGIYVWGEDEQDNPYLPGIAAADILIVTGESESMLTDAVSTGKPVYIYPLKKKRVGPLMALGAWLLKQSSRKPGNRRGTERPQQGLEYLCARILQKEWILPPRDLDSLHRHLVEGGMARMFADAPLSVDPVSRYVQEDLGPRLRLLLEQPSGDLATVPVPDVPEAVPDPESGQVPVTTPEAAIH